MYPIWPRCTCVHCVPPQNYVFSTRHFRSRGLIPFTNAKEQSEFCAPLDRITRRKQTTGQLYLACAGCTEAIASHGDQDSKVRFPPVQSPNIGSVDLLFPHALYAEARESFLWRSLPKHEPLRNTVHDFWPTRWILVNMSILKAK